MDDYKISLGAILDANAKGDLQKSIDNIKDLQVKISKAELTSSAITDIKNQLEENGIDLKIVFGNTNQIVNQAKQTGQQIGKQINQGLSQSMGNSDAVIERFKKSLTNTGMDTHGIDIVINRLKALDVQIDSLNQKVSTSFNGKNYGEDILSVDVAGVDKMGQAVKIMDQYNLATGEYLKTVQSVSSEQSKAGNSVDEFVTKQKKAIASLENDYKKVMSSALDSNSTRPITSDSSFKALETQIDKVDVAMAELRNSTANTFDDAKIKVQKEISNLRILEKQLRNADNVATKLRGNSVDTGFGIAINDLEKLKADSKEYDKMSVTIQNLEKALENVSDSASLNKFNDSLREARAELAKLKSEAMANNRAEKVGINVSDFQSKIDDLKRISPEINDFKTQINGAEVSIESLASELGNVKTQGDISVLNTKWRAFTDAAKAAGIAVREVSDASNARIQLKIDTGEYDSKVTDLLAKTGQWLNLNNTARTSVEQLRAAYQAFASASDGSAKIEAAKQLEFAIKSTTNAVREMNATYATDSSISALAQRYQEFYDKNTAAHHKWGTQLKANLAKLTSGMSFTRAEADKLEKELLDIQNATRQSGKLGLSFFDKLKQGMSAFSQWTSATAIVSKGIQLGKEGIQFVRDLDDALTDVVYTSDITKSQLENLGNSSVKMAKDLKASTANVLEAVKIYSTANATADDILRKSKPAIMLSNVSGMSGSESAKTIQTALNQFELEDTEEGLLDIVDTLEYVSSQLNYDFTEGMKEITEGIEAAGSVAKNAGLDMQEYATMVGIAVEKTGQSGSTIGNAYKTIFSRITKASDVEGTMDEDISKAEEALRGIGVQVRSSENEFRDLRDIMDDIGSKWGELTDTQKAKVGYEVAGTRQLNVLNSLFGAYEQYSDIIDNVDERFGMASESQEKYAESANGRIEKIGATGKSIANNIFDSDSFKIVIDGFQTFLDLIDSATEKLGGLGSIIAGGGIFAALKNVGGAKLY